MSCNVTDQTVMRKQDAQIIALFTSGMKQYEIADSLGISTRTVIRAIKRNLGTVEAIDQKLSTVQRELKRQMPIRERVETLVNVARTSELDFAKISSVKYLNELDGIHPQLEREKVKRDQEQPQTQPMFMLPAGTSVHITVNQSQADSISAPQKPDVIDIKANTNRE